jgi:polysaccharide deacetylase 2 family uncharacterized protein YibQ
MTAATTTKPTVFASRQQVTAALQRAAQRAKQVAEQTGTQLVVGKPISNTRDALLSGQSPQSQK